MCVGGGGAASVTDLWTQSQVKLYSGIGQLILFHSTDILMDWCCQRVNEQTTERKINE